MDGVNDLIMCYKLQYLKHSRYKNHSRSFGPLSKREVGDLVRWLYCQINFMEGNITLDEGCHIYCDEKIVLLP